MVFSSPLFTSGSTLWLCTLSTLPSVGLNVQIFGELVSRCLSTSNSPPCAVVTLFVSSSIHSVLSSGGRRIIVVYGIVPAPYTNLLGSRFISNMYCWVKTIFIMRYCLLFIVNITACCCYHYVYIIRLCLYCFIITTINYRCLSK